MVNQRLQNLLRDSRTNWKFIWIVVILGILAAGGILGYYYWWLKDLEAELAELELRLPVVKTSIEETMEKRGPEETKKVLTITTDKIEYSRADSINVTIKNEGNVSMQYPAAGCLCQGEPEFELQSYENGEWGESTQKSLLHCKIGTCLHEVEIKPGEEQYFPELWGGVGFLPSYKYRFALAGCPPFSKDCVTDTFYSDVFTIKEQPELIKEFTGTLITAAPSGYKPEIIIFRTNDGILYDILGERRIMNELENFRNKEIIVRGYLEDTTVWRGNWLPCLINEQHDCIQYIEKSIFVVNIETRE